MWFKSKGKVDPKNLSETSASPVLRGKEKRSHSTGLR
jgi:hypothetical protein